jgi:hypothetical protein
MILLGLRPVRALEFVTDEVLAQWLKLGTAAISVYTDPARHVRFQKKFQNTSLTLTEASYMYKHVPIIQLACNHI